MDTTIVLAKICGVMCVLIGLSVLNKRAMAAIIDDLLKSVALFWFVGFVAVLIGLVTLKFYRAWSFSWPVLITILGWLSLLKGAVIMLFPDFLSSFYQKVKAKNIVMISGIIALVVGVVLLYEGFMG